MSYRASVIKSIQRGTITLNGVTSNTATITAVDTTKSSLRLLGADLQTDNGVTGTQTEALLAFTNSTTITASRADATGIVRVNFEVVEYYPNVVKSVQRGTIALSGAASNTATITGVVTGKSQCTWYGATTSDGNPGEYAGRTRTKVELTNTTTVTASRGVGTNNCTVGYEVLEFM